ncbi:MAG: imidazoleglycerol-phosphate dehydratase HisB [Oceanicaulis sp.]
MSGFLDLSGDGEGAASALASDLVRRLASVIGVDETRIALAASARDARRAIAASGFVGFEDLTSLGLAALEREPVEGLGLIRLGPDDAPLCAVVGEGAEIRQLILHLATPPLVITRAGLDALKPAARLAEKADRAERDRLLLQAAEFLRSEAGVDAALCDDGLMVRGPVGALGIMLAGAEDPRIAHVRDASTAKALLDHLGLRKGARSASVRRSTKETDIALRVDLDGEGARVATGVHFFDHMLEQIARHGGLGLEVACEGDVEVDAHHTIEDVCLALGEALREALGDKRGIARFGFETPMDETRASVWIDLSGRPYARFDGAVPGERVGDFPVEMCEHAFRSLAETMKAAIHVKVDGENAHHMIESCFKSFGRALRMAKTIEGDALPSTKGVL